MDDSTSVRLAAYGHAIDHLGLFMEWRHKIMLRMAAQLAGTLVVAGSTSGTTPSHMSLPRSSCSWALPSPP